MAKWNTEQIMEDLGTILPVIDIKNNRGRGGDSTDTLVVVLGGVEDKLYVKGFTPKFYGIQNNSDTEVSHLELSDRLQDSGGLNSHDFRLARAYIDIRQYFINRGFVVVPSMYTYL